MTEREYIDTRELSQLIDTIKILNNIDLSNSIVIKKNEYQKIIKIMHNWIDLLFEKIHINTVVRN